MSGPSRTAETLATRLAERYPGVQITVELVHIDRKCAAQTVEGPQQRVTFRAPLERLALYGLVTDKMLEQAYLARHWQDDDLLAGDGYFLREHGGVAALTRYTEATPRPSRKTSVRDAQRELRRFTLRRRKRAS